MNKSYSEKDEIVRRSIILTVVDMMFSESFKNGKELIEAAEKHFKKEYASDNTYGKLITSYQITDAFTRFCLDLPDINEYLKKNATETLNSFEIVEEEMETDKPVSALEQTNALRRKIFSKVFKHFSGKLKQDYDQAIESTVTYCNDKNPEGVANEKLYPELVKIALADVFYETLNKMKTDPASIVNVLLKKLSKEDLGTVIKNAQAYINQ